jgi:hypothetical protein
VEACFEAEAVVVATEWKEFLAINWQAIYDNMSKPAFVFDGRLLLDVPKLTKIGFKVGYLFINPSDRTLTGYYRSQASVEVLNPTVPRNRHPHRVKSWLKRALV